MQQPVFALDAFQQFFTVFPARLKHFSHAALVKAVKGQNDGGNGGGVFDYTEGPPPPPEEDPPPVDLTGTVILPFVSVDFVAVVLFLSVNSQIIIIHHFPVTKVTFHHHKEDISNGNY